jgi:lipopolysaccharide/colanic/teichoic acid biosynthesis glycosyltransferase
MTPIEPRVQAATPADVDGLALDLDGHGTAALDRGRTAGGSAKRLVDTTVSVGLLVVLAPLIAFVAIAIKLESRGPVFFRCRRIGFGGRPFSMLKFRKMREGAAGPALTVACDARFTRVGRFLSLSKIDELPQLWNVLRGDMSLVGPRPEDETFVADYRKAYEQILRVKPGITGLCQLAFVKESEILNAADRLGDYRRRVLPQKVAIDMLYAAKRSFGMDMRILVWTPVAVVARRDVAVARETGRLTLRRRARTSTPETTAPATRKVGDR